MGCSGSAARRGAFARARVGHTLASALGPAVDWPGCPSADDQELRGGGDDLDAALERALAPKPHLSLVSTRSWKRDSGLLDIAGVASRSSMIITDSDLEGVYTV